MALVNLVKVSTATTGTGTLTLSAAIAGYLTMSQAGAVDGAAYSYGISEGSNSEVGTGVWSSASNTLTRVVTNSTNGNAAITLAGSAKVIITPLAADILTIGTTATTAAAGNHNHSGLYAPISSPTFTGTPAAPTATSDTSSTQLATTAFAQSLGAVITKSVVQGQGFLNISTTEAAAGVVIINGTLTVNTNVNFGNSAAYFNKSYVVVNATTGAFTLTLSPSAANASTSIVVAQGASIGVVTNGTIIYRAGDDASTLTAFSANAKGVAPASGGGSTNFLRADGSWAVPSATISDGNKGDITIASGVWGITTNAVVNSDFAQVSSGVFHGRVTSGTGNIENLTGAQATTLLDVFTSSVKGLVPPPLAVSSNSYLRNDGTWRQVTVEANSISYDRLALAADFSFLARNEGSNAVGNLSAISAASATSMLTLFSSTARGVVPASGGGTTTFLRADGTWAAAGSSGASLGANTFTGEQAFAASTTVDPSISITPGSTPSTGTNGDIWIDTNGFNVRFANAPMLIGGNWTDLGANTLYTSTNPSAPTQGVRIYGVRRANRHMIGYITPTGRTERLSPWLGSNNRVEVSASWGTTTMSAMNSAFTVVGTLSAATYATTNYMTTQRRNSITSATSGGLIEMYGPLMCSRLPGNGAGGFHASFRFAFPALNSDCRVLVGLMQSASATASGTNPSAMANLVAFAKDSADTGTFYMIANGSSGTAQKIALTNTGSLTNITSAFFQVEIFCKAGDTVFGYRVSRTTSAGVETVDDGTLTGTAGASGGIPASTTAFSPHLWMNLASATTSTLNFSQFFLETD